MTEKEAREKESQAKKADWCTDDPEIYHQWAKALGYLEAIEKAERILVEALKKIKERMEPCSRCDGDGRLWKDGKAHYQSYRGETTFCSDCAGKGMTVLDSEQISTEALAEWEKER